MAAVDLNRNLPRQDNRIQQKPIEANFFNQPNPSNPERPGIARQSGLLQRRHRLQNQLTPAQDNDGQDTERKERA